MSKADSQNSERLVDQGPAPIRSFDGLTPGPGAQIGLFRIGRELGRGTAYVVDLGHDTDPDISATEQVFRDDYVETDYPRARDYDMAKHARFMMVRETDKQAPPVTGLNIVIDWHRVLEGFRP